MKRLKEVLCLLVVVAALLTPRAGALAQSIPLGTVQGIAPDLRQAERDAFEGAGALVKEYLESCDPTLKWTPSPIYLRTSGIVRLPGQVTEKKLPISGKVFEVTLAVMLEPRHLLEIRRLALQQQEEQRAIERQQRVQERHRWLGLILAGIAAGLVVLKVYLWLEELTRGYSTNLLRAVALVILGLVIAVLIWLA